ncbi:MAG: hypothetical protein COA78_28150 [Blastopirellula sp.]|nr:MAG: hypothetical protein COA78_28150 [Blastopirellula sp.]
MLTELSMAFGVLDLDYVPQGASITSMAAQRLSRLLRSQLSELLDQQGNIGLPGWRAMVFLASKNELTQRELVEYTKIEQAQLSRALTDMEERGLIFSRRCDLDKRSRRFSLTEKGTIEFEEILPSLIRFNQAIDQALDAEELKHFLLLSEKIARASILAIAQNDDKNASALGITKSN